MEVQVTKRSRPSTRIGASWIDKIKSTTDVIGKENPLIGEFSMEGAKAHNHKYDPPGTLEWITLKFFDALGRRVGTAHVYEDGTHKIQESRFGQLLSRRIVEAEGSATQTDDGPGEVQKQPESKKDGGPKGNG